VPADDPRGAYRQLPGHYRTASKTPQFSLFALVLLLGLATFSAVTLSHLAPDEPDAGATPGDASGATSAERAGPGGSRDAIASRLDPPSVSRGATWVKEENAKPGSADWTIPDGDVRPRSIEGFTDKVSAEQGDNVRLFITTEAPTFEAVAFRLGFYADAGARQIWSSGVTTGVSQPECTTDPATRMVDCSNWAPTLDVQLDDDWPPGQYLFKLIPSVGTSTFVPFILRDDDSHSDVLIVSDVTTLQAYNTWGGYSLYTAVGGRPGGRATVVSYDRPMGSYWGQSGILGDTYNIGMLVESLGLDVSYTTNVDQHQQPELMKNHKVIVTGFHDEYYSLEMRDGLEAARDSGVNVMFLGANAVYRRIRFEPSSLGPDRHQVNYRSASADPLNGVDPERVTTSWREGPAARPESTLTGTYYECNQGGMSVPMVIVDGDAWMFEGTNVTDGQSWPDVVQEEYDRVTPSAPTPPQIQVLAHSPLVCRGNASFSDMAYYTGPGGAGVFNPGTLGFEGKLGPLCRPEDVTPANPMCQLRQMAANIVTDFAEGPAAERHPSQPNLSTLGIG
jgi:hypothetical protein